MLLGIGRVEAKRRKDQMDDPVCAKHHEHAHQAPNDLLLAIGTALFRTAVHDKLSQAQHEVEEG